MPGPQPFVLMTCQSITGSDVFGQVHWTVSPDSGESWSEPQPIASLARHTLTDGIEEGVCDVVPEYHERTQTTLAMGHNVYYRNNELTRPNDGRYTVYTVRGADGRWSVRRILEWRDQRATAIYSCGCAQRITLENGNVLVPLTFGPLGRQDRMVGTALCAFDGAELRVLTTGNVLELKAGRGLLEPSLASFGGRFFMTIRAEDGHGYASVSDDGLQWAPMVPWRWDDGEALSMSTTQQRWLSHSGALFLVYTRKAENNVNVFRWRAPLFVARVDTGRLCLVRESEQVVLPLIGDGINDPAHVARMGNFHVVNVSRNESWVTVGETLPDDGWAGDTLMARIRWTVPNTLAG